MHGILALSSLVSLLLVGAPLAALPREEPFDEVTARFTREMLALNPISATAAGHHRHTDWRTAGEFALDEPLDDYSAAGVAHRRISLDALEKELHRFSPASLDEQQQIDFRVMQSALDRTRFELDRVQAYRHNPVFYSNLLASPSSSRWCRNTLRCPFALGTFLRGWRSSRHSWRLPSALWWIPRVDKGRLALLPLP